MVRDGEETPSDSVADMMETELDCHWPQRNPSQKLKLGEVTGYNHKSTCPLAIRSRPTVLAVLDGAYE